MNQAGLQAFWGGLRRHTEARIGLGRVGVSLPTDAVLSLRADHAAARDAVRIPLDINRLTQDLSLLGVPPLAVVASRAASREEYLRRPDLGRELTARCALPQVADEVALVVADGLSPTGIQVHGSALVEAVSSACKGTMTITAPVVATNARVRIGDAVAMMSGAKAVIVLIGERPGLSVVDSVGAYVTFAPGLGTTDADRNCVSNIRPPDGLGYAQAAEIIVGLLAASRRLGRSGIAVEADRAASEFRLGAAAQEIPDSGAGL